MPGRSGAGTGCTRAPTVNKTALPIVLPFVAVLVARLLDEERMLAAELAGYREYCRRVRFRLVPRIW